MIVKHLLFTEVNLAGLLKLFLGIDIVAFKLYNSFVAIVVKLAIHTCYLVHREQLYVWFPRITKYIWLDSLSGLMYNSSGVPAVYGLTEGPIVMEFWSFQAT